MSKTPQIDLIARRAMQQTGRPEAGQLIEVHRVTLDDGTTGLCIYDNAWDKRDCMGESLYCEEHVAATLNKAMPGLATAYDPPQSYRWFGQDMAEVGDMAVIKKAQDKCRTELWDSDSDGKLKT